MIEAAVPSQSRHTNCSSRKLPRTGSRWCFNGSQYLLFARRRIVALENHLRRQSAHFGPLHGLKRTAESGHSATLRNLQPVMYKCSQC
jgi:hypothetical protein